MSKNHIPTIEEVLNFYIEHIEILSLSFDKQYEKLSILGDYLTEDIASDWNLQGISEFTEFCEKQAICDKAANLYSMIVNNFEKASYGNVLFDESIWTLEGLKNHLFWEEQRRLAKELLDELEKIHFL